jgi:peptidylprolyl isomerase
VLGCNKPAGGAAGSAPANADTKQDGVEAKGQADQTAKPEEAKGQPAANADDIPAPPDVAAPPADAERTSTGLASKLLSAGTAPDKPKRWDQVKVHYTGWTTDGKMFDSSIPRGKPITFGLKQVIAGWTEGMQLLVEGDTARFWIPENLAYKGRPGAPAGMLVFDVQLLKIEAAAPPAGAAPAAATPPAGH